MRFAWNVCLDASVICMPWGSGSVETVEGSGVIACVEYTFM